jgi:hypothetical protein
VEKNGPFNLERIIKYKEKELSQVWSSTKHKNTDASTCTPLIKPQRKRTDTDKTACLIAV